MSFSFIFLQFNQHLPRFFWSVYKWFWIFLFTALISRKSCNISDDDKCNFYRDQQSSQLSRLTFPFLILRQDKNLMTSARVALYQKRIYIWIRHMAIFFNTVHTQTKERLNILSCYHLLVVTTVNPKIRWYIGDLQKTKELFMKSWKDQWFNSVNNQTVCVDYFIFNFNYPE